MVCLSFVSFLLYYIFLIKQFEQDLKKRQHYNYWGFLHHMFNLFLDSFFKEDPIGCINEKNYLIYLL